MHKLRANLSGGDRVHAESAALKRLTGLIELRRARCVMIYLSARGELDTFALAGYLHGAGISVCVPVTEGSDMRAAMLPPGGRLVSGALGISVPENPVFIPAEQIDFCVTPLLAADARGNRIGWGKGYYDRFFEGFSGLKCGYCFDFQVISSVPAGTEDKPLDYIVTDRRLIECAAEEQ